MTPEPTADVLTRVDRAWAELERTVQTLSERELTEVRDPAGWAVKDHLMHLAAWEQALLAKLEGRPRHHALGLAEGAEQAEDDTVNAAIFVRHRDRPLGEVLETARAVHRATRARLLDLPESQGRPLVEVAEIAGNTWEHYADHLRWIRTLVGRPGP